MTDKILFTAIFFIIGLSFLYRSYAVNRVDAYLLRAGLICTLAADFCMLILYNNTVGLILFICVQTIYFIRYTRVYAAVLLPVLSGVFVRFFYRALALDTQLAAIYACMLAAGTLSAFVRRKAYPFPNRIFIPLGMLMFLLCDINVALMNVFSAGPKRTAARVLIWVFYLPSQAMLSASGMKIGSYLIKKKLP